MDNVLNDLKNRIFCVIAVFLFGNMIIRFPKGEGQQHSFWGYIICFVFSVIIGLLFSRMQSINDNFGVRLFDTSINNTSLRQILKFTLFVFCLLCFVICLKDYIVMIESIRLRNTPRIILSIFFILTVFFLSRAGKKVILMFSFVNLIFIVLGVFVMFIFSIRSFNFNFFIDSLDFNFNNSIKQGLTFYIHSFGQLILCLLFVGHVPKKDSQKNTFLGILVGGTIFLVCFLNVILMIGNEIIINLQFPYASVTGMIVSKDSYNRLDAITYYIYFICDLIKGSILLNIILELYKDKVGLKRWVTIIVVFLGVMFSSFGAFEEFLQSKPINFILLCLEIAFPIILAVVLYRPKLVQS